MRVILLILAVLVAAAVVAIRTLPWWALVAIFASLAIGAPILFRWGLRRLLLIPFRAKGAVLRDAVVEVHAVERVAPPLPDEADQDDPGPREHFRIEVTITPREATGAFKLWEPSSLTLVGPDARPGEPAPGETELALSAVEVQDASGRFEADEGMKYPGPQRLRLRVATPPGQRRARFRYYLEVFGDLRLPGPAGARGFRRPPLTAAR